MYVDDFADFDCLLDEVEEASAWGHALRGTTSTTTTLGSMLWSGDSLGTARPQPTQRLHVHTGRGSWQRNEFPSWLLHIASSSYLFNLILFYFLFLFFFLIFLFFFVCVSVCRAIVMQFSCDHDLDWLHLNEMISTAFGIGLMSSCCE